MKRLFIAMTFITGIISLPLLAEAQGISAYGKPVINKTSRVDDLIKASDGLKYHKDFTTQTVTNGAYGSDTDEAIYGNADFANGTYTPTISIDRSLYSDTFCATDGTIYNLSQSNLLNYTNGLWTSTGFVTAKGIKIEPSRINQWHDAAFNNAAAWKATGGTKIKLIVDGSVYTTNYYPSANIMEFTGTTAGHRLGQDTDVLKLSSGSKYSVACSMKGSGTLHYQFYDGASQYSSSFTLTSSYRVYSATFTAASSTSYGAINIRLPTNNNVDAFISWCNVEGYLTSGAPYSTSFIPNTSTTLNSKRPATTFKIPILGNTDSAQTILIKFVPMNTFANDATNRTFIDSDTKSRLIRKETTGTVITAYPNATDSVAVKASGTTTYQAGVSYVMAFVFSQSSPYVKVYTNGTLEGQYTSGTFTPNIWSGTDYLYIGSDSSGANQASIILQSITQYEGDKSNDITAITNALN